MLLAQQVKQDIDEGFILDPHPTHATQNNLMVQLGRKMVAILRPMGDMRMMRWFTVWGREVALCMMLTSVWVPGCQNGPTSAPFSLPADAGNVADEEDAGDHNAGGGEDVGRHDVFPPDAGDTDDADDADDADRRDVGLSDAGLSTDANMALCEGACEAGSHTACTCSPSDPCGWVGNGSCDLNLFELSCASFPSHFQDDADCAPPCETQTCIHDNGCCPGYCTTLEDSDCALEPELDFFADPDRPTAPFECTGTPLTSVELATFFKAGTGVMWFAADINHPGRFPELVSRPMTRRFFSRNCTTLTGCTDWASVDLAESSVWLNVHFAIEVEGTGDVYFRQYQAGIEPGPNEHPSYEKIITSSDLILVNPHPAMYSGENFWRLRVTWKNDGTACVSVSGVQLDWPAPERPVAAATFVLTDTIEPQSAEWSPATEVDPADAASYTCDGTPLRDLEIGQRWFERGARYVTIPPAARSSIASFRACHPVTGCTAWRSEEWLYRTTDCRIGLDLLYDSELWFYDNCSPLTYEAPITNGVFSRGFVTDSCIGYSESGPPSWRWKWAGPGAVMEGSQRARITAPPWN